MDNQECKGCKHCTPESSPFSSVVASCQWGGKTFGVMFELGLQPWCPINRGLKTGEENESHDLSDRKR